MTYTRKNEAMISSGIAGIAFTPVMAFAQSTAERDQYAVGTGSPMSATTTATTVPGLPETGAGTGSDFLLIIGLLLVAAAIFIGGYALIGGSRARGE
jgi:LPXTG-motif cell wall-anchored protein